MIHLSESDRTAFLEATERAIEDSSRELDRALLSLAGGGLGVSIAFARQLSPHPVARWVALIAWIAFGLTLLVVLGSLATSQKAHRKARQMMLEGVVDPMAYRKLGRLTFGLNVGAALAFLGGVGFLVSYVFLNL